MIILAVLSLVLAAIPCLLFLKNIKVYRPPQLPAAGVRSKAVSVLIPARNEEKNIAEAIKSVQANAGVELEIVIMDDGSTDKTVDIVSSLAKGDSRIRIARAPSLPAGWCGKQNACQHLAELARHPVLVFIDADVRLANDALRRMENFLEANSVQLASGVPRQELGTFMERLLIPLIHFVLLGFLPIDRMRKSVKPAYAAGCGQLFVADRDAYFKAGGHRSIASSVHDGLRLPESFRKAGFRTDLFDATDVARCRMYSTAAEVWRGLAKNATEGLASPSLIVPMTLILFIGQVLPFILLARYYHLSPSALWCALAAATLAWLPRFIALRQFHQSLLGALLHPVGIFVLLAIQWWAFIRKLVGTSESWKGRPLVQLQP